MQPRTLIRNVGIAAGVAGLAGFGIGLAAGKTQKPEDLPVARRLPSDLCARLGDVSALFPGTVELKQTGIGEVRCSAEVDEDSQPTHTRAGLTVTAETFPATRGGTAEAMARAEYDGEPWQPLMNRPYPTKINAEQQGEDVWDIAVLTIRGDLVVKVDYNAAPVTREAAQAAVLAIADKAVWEAK
jgi:hypothetical protein